MRLGIRIDIGRLRLVLDNRALLSGVKIYNKRIGYVALAPFKLLWCFYSK